MHTPELENIVEEKIDNVDVDVQTIVPKIKVEMSEQDKVDMDFIIQSIDDAINKEYGEAFRIEEELLNKVRVKLPGGGYAKNPDGSYMEDWSRVDLPTMESFIQAASSESFFASQKVINSYAEAVFTKYAYDDSYGEEYSRILNGTIADKTAKAKRRTQKERWVALYKALYYKRAKEVVDKLDNHVRRVEKIYSERHKEIDRGYCASKK